MTTLEYDIKLASTIKAYRELRRIKQSTIAEAMGITQTAYCKIENGDAAISPGQLKIIASVLKTSMLQILVIVEGSELINFQFTPISELLLEFVKMVEGYDKTTVLSDDELEFIIEKIKTRNSLLVKRLKPKYSKME